MSVPVLTFFNSKGGIGKTFLAYHVAWMISELDFPVLIADLDPQANLTAEFLDDAELDQLWDGQPKARPRTIYDCVQPLAEADDLATPELRSIVRGLDLLPGDLSLSAFEDLLASEWTRCLESERPNRPLRAITAFWQVIQRSAEECGARVALVDLGPGLSAINRSALVATDFVVVPLAADLASRQSLRHLGPTLRRWREAWRSRRNHWSQPDFSLPEGAMQPIGYLMQELGLRLARPVEAHDRWAKRMPGEYARYVLGRKQASRSKDSACIATVKYNRSLILLGQAARKPIFKLTLADGGHGNHALAARDAYKDFAGLAMEVLRRADIPLSGPA